MGVLGLTPFLQKTCPEVIRLLPSRLQGLAGKKVVIDGTLITTRFHFAPAPHRFRHVLGWYRLVKELQEAGVEAVCVFDGKQRNIAKGPEMKRRKEVRRKTAARGVVEQDRSKRLRKLSTMFRRFQALESSARERVASKLRQLNAENDVRGMIPSGVFDTLGLVEPSKKPPDRLEGPACPHLPLDDDIFTSEFITDEELQSTLEDARLGPFSATDDTHSTPREPFTSSPEDPTDYIPPDHPWFQYTTPPYSSDSVYLPLPTEPDIYTHVSPIHMHELHQPMQEEMPPSLSTQSTTADEDVLNRLALLYREYRQSISKLASLAVPPDASQPPVTDAGATEIQTEIVMTKAQHQLILEEGKFWNRFLDPSVGTEDTPSTTPAVQPLELPAPAEQLPEPSAPSAAPAAPAEQPPELSLAKLSRTSDIMSASFVRRMNPPTKQTFRESKEILLAMGIPCLESSGAFEAEALASSMVLNGLADYVVSEDTDVLVYEAPLVRNLTNRSGPLTVVSGAEIRAALQLDRTSFVDFALLLGTDFSQRIKNIGPTRALKLIREHGSIERIIELEKEYIPRIPHEAYISEVEAARLVFCTLPPVPEEGLLEQRVSDEAEIIEVLQRYGLGQVVKELGEWNDRVALQGNYFNDNPSAL
ncbi:PIN domain-like protein [Lyophyllum atratum]|nr:PIN domain-like protein [Lyophyllum atratum]